MGWWKTLANINCHVIYSDNVDKNRWAGVPKRGHIAGDPTAIWWHFMSLTAFVFNFRLKYELPSNFEKTQTILLRCEELSFGKNWFAYTCRNRFDPIWCNKERKELTKATCKVIRPDCISHTHTQTQGGGGGLEEKPQLVSGWEKHFPGVAMAMASHLTAHLELTFDFPIRRMLFYWLCIRCLLVTRSN